jgi:alpha-galactosidase
MANSQRRPWDRYRVQLYDWDRWAGERDLMWQAVATLADGRESIEPLRRAASEGVYEIVSGIAGDLNLFMEAVNIPNRGHIANLPDSVIVEAPGVVSLDGVDGIAVGSLPEPVAELCRREAALVDLVVRAGVEGDRDAALQALLFDPHVDDIALARDILDTYLEAHALWLPQFHGRWRWEG